MPDPGSRLCAGVAVCGGRVRGAFPIWRKLARATLVNPMAAVCAAQRLVSPAPVVMFSINDRVGTGFVESLARPGGYTTGIATHLTRRFWSFSE
jgi:ABC-type uncharacterized transport system substrate-binding protein